MADLKAAQQALNAAKDAARRRALGKPLTLSDANLDTLATVSEADVPAAQALWRKYAPAWAHDLMDAQRDED